MQLVIDTDCANEIDDQFALAWALLTPECLSVKATIAAPFSFRHHLAGLRAADEPGYAAWAGRLATQGRSVADLDRELVGPAEGMRLSLEEIRRIHHLCRADRPTLAGAERYMKGPGDVVSSDGADAIIDLASGGEPPLYVAAMGCLTNVATALIRAPEIASRITVIWTAGFPTRQPHGQFAALNLMQDPHAVRHVFDCGVPIVYLPGYHVGAQLRLSKPEMRSFVKGRGRLGDYLWDLFDRNPLHRMYALDDVERRTSVIWDMIDIAWLIDPDWVPTFATPSPILTEELCWQARDGRHMIREAYDIRRDDIFRHFFDKLAQAA